MKSYLDTSVLFPAMITAHPNHLEYKRFFETTIKKSEIICLSLHVYAELYANLTRFPLGDKIHPKLATKSILELRKVVSTIDLDQKDYEAALIRCANLELSSGIIYDALHLQAAIKAKVDVFYTSNLRDFKRLETEDISFTIKEIQ